MTSEERAINKDDKVIKLQPLSMQLSKPSALVSRGLKEYNKLLEVKKTNGCIIAGLELVFIKGGGFEMGGILNDGGFDYHHDNYRSDLMNNLSAPRNAVEKVFEGLMCKEYMDSLRELIFDQQPHAVIVQDYYLGKTEVTVAQYRKYCIATNRKMPSEPEWGWQDEHPIVNVDWADAKAFCDWVGCRLPTEREWEYAAREGGKVVRFGNGKNIADSKEMNFNADPITGFGENPIFDGDINDGISWLPPEYAIEGVFRGKTTPVLTFAPNSFGLFDMSGNVYEWCSDWYTTNDNKDRVVRGGAWDSPAEGCRVANRMRRDPYCGGNFVGFRCAKT